MLDKKEIRTSNLLSTLLSNPPPEVDLTMVGGSALVFWTASYIEVYPDCFDIQRVAGTKDIDFIGLTQDARACHEHWGGRLVVPDQDDMTPELAILSIPDGDDDIQIDFLPDLIGIPKSKALKGRFPIGYVDDENGIYVLSEILVLTNRVINTRRLAKYQFSHGIDQVYNAMSVVKAAIYARLDAGSPSEAARLMHCVLDLAKNRSIGVEVYIQFGIDLLDAVVLEDKRFPNEFQRVIPPLVDERSIVDASAAEQGLNSWLVINYSQGLKLTRIARLA